ncbi:TetR/AcrR family transcriptional regulator [Streptomyces sp. NPDC026672]|uniref:TetR/AcrR family transcriptional regulator n=1 Tax=unclassified Streptomyces TaxID=2593676 RepID=UPI0033E9E3FD
MPQVSVKGKLVDAAEDVFRRQGFSGASVQDITTAAEVPKGSFYNHFPSKQALAAEIMRRYVDATDLTALRDDRLSPVERLRGHFTGQADRTRSTGLEFGCLIGTLASEVSAAGDPVRTEVTQGVSHLTQAIADVVRAGQDADEITKAQPADALAAFLIDAYEGATLRAKVSGDPDDVLRTLDTAFLALRP